MYKIDIKYKDVKNKMRSYEGILICLKITNEEKRDLLKDWYYPNTRNYSVERILYRETKKEVFQEFIELMKSGILEFDNIDKIDSNELARGLVEEFMNPDTKNLYPEIFI